MNTLSNTGLFKGAQLLEFDRLASTNDKAIETIKQGGIPEGSVILTHKQFQGRGQFGNTWESVEKQSLSCSICLFPNFVKASNQFILNQITSLAICKALQHWGFFARIKWPNDIYIVDNKLGGILIDASILGQNMQYAVIGIGLNVNQSSFGKDIPNPISMKQVSSRDYDIHEVLYEIHKLLDSRYMMLQSQGSSKIHADYIERMYRIGEFSLFEDKTNGNQFEATINGVDSIGRLILEDNSGPKSYDMTEIKMIV